MSNALLERPDQTTVMPVGPTINDRLPQEVFLPLRPERASPPMGVIALKELGIDKPLPPRLHKESKEKHHRLKTEGIDEQTVADLHTILGEDPHNIDAIEKARKRLESGTITERALAFATDVLCGSTYDNTIYSDVPPPDTRMTAGFRSRRLAIEDDKNSFLVRASRMKLRDGRKLSNPVAQKIESLNYNAERAKEHLEKGDTESKELVRSAADLVLSVAGRLDAKTVCKLFGGAGNEDIIESVFLNADRDTLDGVGAILLDEQPSTADAYLFAKLHTAHRDMGYRLSSPYATPISIEETQRVRDNQKQLQDMLARLNQTRWYARNEVEVMRDHPNLPEQDFQTLHTLRSAARAHQVPVADLPMLREYIVENPVALEVVQSLGTATDAVSAMGSILKSPTVGLNSEAKQADPDHVKKAEQTFSKLIEALHELPDSLAQEKMVYDLQIAINHGMGSKVWGSEFVGWMLDEAPTLSKSGEGFQLADRWFNKLFDERFSGLGRDNPEAMVEILKKGLSFLETFPRNGAAYDYLRHSGDKSDGFLKSVIDQKGEAMVEYLRELDSAVPYWISNSLFAGFVDMYKEASNGEGAKGEGGKYLASLTSFLAELKSYEDLSRPMQDLAVRMLEGTSLENGFEPIRVIFKPENRQIVELFCQLDLANPFIRGFGLTPDRLDILRPITEQLKNHPLMASIGTAEMRNQKAFARSLLSADDPLKYADAMYQGIKIFGTLNNQDLTDILYAVYRGDKALESQSDELKKIVGEGGQPGIDKLSANLMKFRDQVLCDEIDLEALEHSPLHLTYFKALTRFEISQWGSHFDNQLLLQIKFQAENPERGRFKLIDEEAYKPSELLRIAEIDQEKLNNFEITKDGMTQWEEIVADLGVGLDIATQHPEKAQEVIDDLTSKVDVHVERLEVGRLKMAEKLEKMPDGKRAKLQEKLSELESEIEELRAIDESALMDITSFLKNVSVLGRYKDTHRSIRKVLFATMLMKSPQEVERANNFVVLERDRQEFIEDGETETDPPRWWKHEPDLQDIQELADLVQHVTNQETWGEAFKNFGLYKTLDNILNVNAINENINRGLNIGNSGTRTMEFRPTRGLLMELSGHMADACWASRYESIAGQFPNFTSVSMIQKPGTKDARFIGAGFLIEAKDAKGEPILVIRGLNPIQNVIEQVDPKDFFEKFSEYARGIAEKRGMKLGVVIDDHSGGSATNRPALFEYLSKQVKPKTKQVILGHEPETTFNSYQITHDTYLL